ncbi:hypothetical protein ACVIHI_008286 [Bradyrhizobium sp. USDA 4524]|uniref:hypothetical protein n=1 Tax=unclassified Bradyrhizobium TaxID=2631580 RepID=UPI00209D5BE9|nr:MULTISPECIES: hypothetical protein [unclassified Bradyrhizobium]MCP1838791.1 hypothetical protein [Bradyrhizobium sp. USDA 4538]MCP1899357.1 hypothetical protein [Bradyrhizobium sp. USDA 4537]MCP1986531.1 hypothetical protein [Bradyrhizobium sp. USDA 4539]
MADRVELPKDKQLASMVLEADKNKQEMGFLGKFFGAKEHAATYFAGITILVTLIAAATLAYSDQGLRGDAMKAFVGLAATALGYLFGSGTRPRI